MDDMCAQIPKSNKRAAYTNMSMWNNAEHIHRPSGQQRLNNPKSKAQNPESV